MTAYIHKKAECGIEAVDEYELPNFQNWVFFGYWLLRKKYYSSGYFIEFK